MCLESIGKFIYSQFFLVDRRSFISSDFAPLKSAYFCVYKKQGEAIRGHQITVVLDFCNSEVVLPVGRSSSAVGKMLNFILLGTLCTAALVIYPIAINAAVFREYSDLPGIRMPNHQHSMYEDDQSTTGCGQFGAEYKRQKPKVNEDNPPKKNPMRVKLMHRDSIKPHPITRTSTRKDALIESCARDRSRAHAFHKRIRQKTGSSSYNSTDERISAQSLRTGSADNSSDPSLTRHSSANRSTTNFIATLESGVSVGSGEYFMDVFIGTPPRHFPLILDTGSDLNWVQCLPCEDCYDQEGPLYNPSSSSSYRPISCGEPRCDLVSSPQNDSCSASPHGTARSCKYFYWYGDQSNTSGDFALETFTVNISTAEALKVTDVMFGCGHANRGLFHGAAGLLGLGRGPLSFTSQLQKIYGHKFSYCLVDRNNNMSVSSTLVFGEDEHLKSHPNLQYTSLLKNRTVDTFYYVGIRRVSVGGEYLNISSDVWDINEEGYGGTIIDSGTTLTYFAQPAYDVIRGAFEAKISYPRMAESPPLSPCYNVSGIQDVKLPEFSIVFRDGAVWKLPAENYFIEEDGMICLAILGTPTSSLSILGNYQQQNFHILYDVDNSRLGFAPMRCSSM